MLSVTPERRDFAFERAHTAVTTAARAVIAQRDAEREQRSGYVICCLRAETRAAFDLTYRYLSDTLVDAYRDAGLLRRALSEQDVEAFYNIGHASEAASDDAFWRVYEAITGTDRADARREPYSVRLDAESVRAEVAEAPGEYDAADRAHIDSLTDTQIGAAINKSVNEALWTVYDNTRSDAIQRLLADLPDEGDEDA